MVQSRVHGTEPSDFCARCFKDAPKLHYVDGKELYLCGGCGYDLRAWTNFLRANGVGIRLILLPVEEREESRDQGSLSLPGSEEGIEGVEGGGNLPANAKGRGRARK